MQDEDEFGFWDDDGWQSRLHTHRHAEFDTEVQRSSHARNRDKNPLVARLGALVVVGVLAIPVAAIVGGSDGPPSVDGGQSGAVDPSAAPTSEVTLPPAVVDAAPAVDSAVESTSPPAVVEQAPATAPPEALPALEATAGTEAVTPTTPKPAKVTKKRSCAISYKPVQGDYWILVARKVDVKLSELLAANDATTDTPIYPGFTICLPANATVRVAAAETPATTGNSPSSSAEPATTPKPTSSAAKPTTSTVKPTVTSAKPTTTTAAPTTTPPPPKINYSRDQVTQIIRDVWPDDLEDEALRIATRESNLIPTAKNSCCYGLFQIHFTANQSTLKGWGITSASMLFDPSVNAYAAYAMYLRAGGWGPWQ